MITWKHDSTGELIQDSHNDLEKITSRRNNMPKHTGGMNNRMGNGTGMSTNPSRRTKQPGQRSAQTHTMSDGTIMQGAYHGAPPPNSRGRNINNGKNEMSLHLVYQDTGEEYRGSINLLVNMGGIYYTTTSGVVTHDSRTLIEYSSDVLKTRVPSSTIGKNASGLPVVTPTTRNTRTPGGSVMRRSDPSRRPPARGRSTNARGMRQAVPPTRSTRGRGRQMPRGGGRTTGNPTRRRGGRTTGGGY